MSNKLYVLLEETHDGENKSLKGVINLPPKWDIAHPKTRLYLLDDWIFDLGHEREKAQKELDAMNTP